MMDNFKLRAWDAEGGEMISWEALIEQEVKLVDVSAAEAFGRHTFMRYTGLKDKKGVEIYEGDILQFKDGTRRRVAHDVEHTGFMLVGEDPVNPLWQMHSAMEIVGNIYEHKELLEQAA